MCDLKNQQMKQNIFNPTSLKRYRINIDDESYPWWLRSAYYHSNYHEDIASGVVYYIGDINTYRYSALLSNYTYSVLLACVI